MKRKEIDMEMTCEQRLIFAPLHVRKMAEWAADLRREGEALILAGRQREAMEAFKYADQYAREVPRCYGKV